MNGIILAKLTLMRFGRFKNQILFSSLFNLGAVAVAWCAGPPSDAPSNAGLAGVLGKQLFELRRSEFLIAARQAE
jgi:hypothetical protein